MANKRKYRQLMNKHLIFLASFWIGASQSIVAASPNNEVWRMTTGIAQVGLVIPGTAATVVLQKIAAGAYHMAKVPSFYEKNLSKYLRSRGVSISSAQVAGNILRWQANGLRALGCASALATGYVVSKDTRSGESDGTKRAPAILCGATAQMLFEHLAYDKNMSSNSLVGRQSRKAADEVLVSYLWQESLRHTAHASRALSFVVAAGSVYCLYQGGKKLAGPPVVTDRD